ncbi:UDP-N-acetylglucosamine:LPS N-acetylglucosamine transferase [Salibacterium salarium]|uniref:glycosyltransferase n=1 Tax=Salibacterium salarium TaxID=284579 RepID=UPI00277DD6DC|nr:glycosyltransferase [Salibacterium salarium]MDQ0298821.1 UDP-N-acetylglucosamine:LPS N-acetylglucosamine transferase [Salibacterium salarium]
MRIHIWTVSYGHGHNKAALLLHKEAEAMKHECVIFHPLEEGYQVLHIFSSMLYRTMLSFTPYIWRKMSQQVFPAVVRMLAQVFEKKVQEGLKADLILSVHPLLTALAGEGMKRMGSFIPLYHVATDYWQAPVANHPAVNGFFLPDIDKENRTSMNAPVFPTGIPVEKLNKRYTKKECCLEHGWDFSKPLLLVCGGGESLFPFQKVVEELKKLPTSSTIVVIEGKRKRKETIQNPKDNVHVIPFTDRFTDYLQAADVFITKAGGMTLTETTICETPTVLYAPLAGQEERNACYFVKKQAASWTFTLEAMRKKVATYIHCPFERERMKRRQRRLQRPESTKQIITAASQHALGTVLHAKINSK